MEKYSVTWRNFRLNTNTGYFSGNLHICVENYLAKKYPPGRKNPRPQESGPPSSSAILQSNICIQTGKGKHNGALIIEESHIVL